MKEDLESKTSPILSILKNTINDVNASHQRDHLKQVLKFQDFRDKEEKMRLLQTTSQIVNQPPNIEPLKTLATKIA